MTEAQQLGVYEFDSYRLDVVERTLWNGNRRLDLNGRAFDVLAALVRRAGKLVTKDELFQVAWHGRVVEEGNLHVQISNLRKVLGRKAITTVSRYGYRLETLLKNEDSRATKNWPGIPSPVSPLIGRAKEVESLKKLLLRHRLVTIKGMGGFGKSRLAIAVAKAVALNERGPRCWYVNLSITEQENYLNLELNQPLSNIFLGSAVADHLPALREAPTLIVIDGCELAASSVAKTCRLLLEACPELTILCTSRKPLGFLDEHIFECPPLDPEGAKELFTQRLGIDSQSGAVTSTLDRILPRLEGVPLAIEIAAGLMRRVGASWLEEHLPSRMNSFVGLDPSLPDRHRTLDATIEWSYRLLDADEKRFLNAISVLQTSFTISDSEIIAKNSPNFNSDPLKLIIGLIDNSLLLKESMGDQLRYRLPETVRAYAQTLLEASSERESTLQAREKWVRQLVKDSVLERRGINWRDRIKTISVAYKDIVASLHRSIKKGSWEAAADIAYGLFPFWIDSARFEEGLKITTVLLEKFPAKRNQAYYQLAHALGGLTQDLGDYIQSDVFLGEAVGEFRYLPNSKALLAIASNDWGVTKHYLGNHNDAEGLYEESLKLSVGLGLSHHEVQVRSNLAVLLCYQDKFERAEGILVEALELHQHLADPKGHALCKSWLAACRLEAGDLVGHLQLSRDAVAIYQEQPEDFLTGALIHRLASALALNKNVFEASRNWRAAESITSSYNNERALVELLESATIILEQADRADTAIKLNKFLTDACSKRQGFMTPVRARRLGESAKRLECSMGTRNRSKGRSFDPDAGFGLVVAQVRAEIAGLPT